MKRPSFLNSRSLVVLGAALAFGAVLQFTDTNPAVSQTLTLHAYESPEDPGLEPSSSVWGRVSGVNVPLTAQTGAYAAGGGTVQTINVKAVHYDGQIFFRVSWPDGSADEASTRVEDFADAVALEFPAKSASTVPSICMGQADAGVNIWHWRADSNVGLKDPVDVYANSSVDGYPSLETLFFTAREAGNPFANPELGPVQSLISRTFGELTAAGTQDVSGLGERTDDGWAVVFSRPFASVNASYAEFAPSTQTDMALAVWDGSNDERNGRKSVSQFVTLKIGDAPAFAGDGNNNVWIALAAVGLLLGVSAVGAGLAMYGYREGRR
jgi:DMSO reductase family type II enzyme heme b subunit